MTRKHQHVRHRTKRRGEGKRTTVRAVFKAINKYPRGKGASVREIHRIIAKSDKGPEKRTLSSVKQAVARAVRKGSIKAPKGWHGFRGIPVITPKERERRAAKKSQPQIEPKKSRSAEKEPPGKFSIPWFSSLTTSAEPTDYGADSGSGGDGWGRSRSREDGLTKDPQSRTRKDSSRGARSHSRGGKHGGRRPGRPRKELRKKARSANRSKSSNVNAADASDNCAEEGNEGSTESSLWPGYCIVS